MIHHSLRWYLYWGQSRCLACLLLAVSLVSNVAVGQPAAPAAGAAAAGPRRIAVLVGANASALGRQPLRYAYRDAERLADALIRVGSFAPGDVQVLRDPPPQALQATLNAQAARLRGDPESLLFFYYSGHADSEAIYPKGEPLPLAWLRDLLQDTSITVRVGFIDACRGGGWTQAKGLMRDEGGAFDIPPLAGLESAGSVLIASSSGLENAHESQALEGSFFTYHFTAGLLGAADRSEDGEISLNEAFDYAKFLTIRDTARLASTPQHPSFDVHLRGRRDLLLARISPQRATVRLEQERGPLEILDLRTGQRLAETIPGRRAIPLMLPPGRYLVRRPVRRIYSADEIEVGRGGTLVVRERDLRPATSAAPDASLAKGGLYQALLPLEHSTPERGVVELHLGVSLGLQPSVYLPGSQLYLASSGYPLSINSPPQTFLPYVSAFWGLTDRLEWQIGTGALAYRLGQPGHPEAILWGGLLGWALGSTSNDEKWWSYRLGLGLDVRIPFAKVHSLIASASVQGDGYAGDSGSAPPWTLRPRIDLGYRVTVARRVTFNLAVGFELNALYEGHLPQGPADGPQIAWGYRIGSVQTLGLRPLPLVQVHLSRWFSIDGYLGATITAQGVQQTYMLGATMLVF